MLLLLIFLLTNIHFLTHIRRAGPANALVHLAVSSYVYFTYLNTYTDRGLDRMCFGLFRGSILSPVSPFPLQCVPLACPVPPISHHTFCLSPKKRRNTCTKKNIYIFFRYLDMRNYFVAGDNRSVTLATIKNKIKTKLLLIVYRMSVGRPTIKI